MSAREKPSAFWAIDFDRCIGNVDRLYRLLETVVIEVTPLNVAQLEAARREIELSGGSFDVLGYLREVTHVSQATYEEVMHAFLKHAHGMRQQLLELGAEELFRYLDEQTTPYAIVSYGNPDWQRLKIQAVGYGAMPAHITAYPEKGRLITDWYDTSRGRFAIPASITGSTDLSVDEVVLVDDKAKAFQGLPAKARGYWVHPLSGELLISQQGTVPGRVVTVQGLYGVIEAEGLRNTGLYSDIY